jgi:chromosome segregation ATPase
VEGHSSRLEQAEGRILELEDKIEIKGKTEELLVKQLKSRRRNMLELNSSINFIKHTLKDLKIYIDSNTLVVGDFNMPLSPIDKSSK